MEETVFQWKRTKEGGACILRGYGASPFVVVPDEMEGIPVTELGDYCFSDSGKEGKDGQFSAFQRELSGKFIQKVSLPDSVKKIGNLAFYNCTGLEEIQMGPALAEFGSDAFMNCLHLKTIRIRCGIVEKNGLKQLLGQRTSDTTVIFEKENQVEAVLLYPEYYEMYDEVGPAHFFALNLTGEGFRARQCFREGIVDLSQYDGVFEQATAEESPHTLCQMAVNRLCYPAGLSQEARARYQAYLGKQEEILVQDLIRAHSLEVLETLFQEDILTANGKEESVRLASQSGWPEGAAAMLRLQQKSADSGKKDRYSFDDF